MSDLFGPVIFRYTRADALRDGVLYDVSDPLGREAGIRVPVAVTAGVLATVDAIEEGSGESRDGRLWDILFMFAWAARSARGDRVDFAVQIGDRLEDLYALIGPGDEGEPVLTILHILED